MIEDGSEITGYHFWTVLLRDEDLFSEIGQLACHSQFAASTQSKAFGSIDLEIKQCSFFGLSYMSDTYFLTASTHSNQLYRAFGKVIGTVEINHEIRFSIYCIVGHPINIERVNNGMIVLQQLFR